MAAISSTGLSFTEEECRAELRAVLASDGLRRSLKLSRLLTYLCDKRLSGRAEEITEYSIAIEALGRTAQFDPQQDAVVRVDTYHLRKRLKEYYAGPGASHHVQIVIPSGQYAPLFTAHVSTPPVVPIEKPVAVLPVADASSERLPRFPNWRLFAVLALLGLAGALAAPHYSQILLTLGKNRTANLPAPAQVDDEAIRIAAGGRTSAYVDHAGRLWQPDRYFTGGTPFQRAGITIQRTNDPELFQSGREGQFAYDIPLRPGIYELHLYFAETAVTSDTMRSVTVTLNGQPASSFDVASDAGAVHTATAKIFRDVRPASDGKLHLMFPGAEPNFVNAIEILPGIRGKIRPIRITTRDQSFRDHSGQIWLPDRWAAGGRKSTRAVPIDGTADAELYQFERVGHFSYEVPVAEHGMYTVVLHFSETWFASPNALGGVGSRVFDVYCNGATLLHNFDILQEAGGGHRAVVRTFHHVPASPLGKIGLTFIPVANYALLNAIEVIEE